MQSHVLDIIRNMGYSNYLRGTRPKTLEGKIVSDADMCDAMGANGIIRSIVYAASEKGSGTIFNQKIFPNIDISADEYNSTGTTHTTDNAINHFFEKMLKLKDLMMTESGKHESLKRHKFLVDFLKQFFTEEKVSKKWFDLLSKFK